VFQQESPAIRCVCWCLFYMLRTLLWLQSQHAPVIPGSMPAHPLCMSNSHHHGRFSDAQMVVLGVDVISCVSWALVMPPASFLLDSGLVAVHKFRTNGTLVWVCWPLDGLTLEGLICQWLLLWLFDSTSACYWAAACALRVCLELWYAVLHSSGGQTGRSMAHADACVLRLAP
jgi:hypothetical protein